MHVSILLGAIGLLTTAVSGFIPDKYDFGNLPADHVLFGAQDPRLMKRQTRTSSTISTSTRVPDSQCTNGPNTRSCWSNGFSVATDFDAKWPTTGVTRQYNIFVTNTTCNPDGHGPKTCLLFNGTYPGPTLTANWGDYMQITFTNQLANNATSIHFHGIRQLNTNTQDGVNGITECPIAPGQSQTFTWQATQFGTTWYHSHHTVQYGDGMIGPIVINGPASANYDIDMGPLPLGDWYYDTAFIINQKTNSSLQSGTPPPPSDSIMIDGKNKDQSGNGAYTVRTMTKGMRYLLRLINTSADNNIRFSIDGHILQVVTVDFVPIKPFYTDNLLIALGQRYEVIVIANQTAGNFWIRADPVVSCFSFGNFYGRAILNYAGVPVANPTTNTTVTDNSCNEPASLVPWVPNTAGSAAAFRQQAKDLEVNFAIPGTTTNQLNFVVWAINQTSVDIQWGNPILSYVMSGNTTYPAVSNLIELPNQGVWTYWILQISGGTNNPIPVPHPIHLHGHDFYVLGRGRGVFNMSSDPDTLTFQNPVRRDTTLLPGNGWLAIAFPTDNPGAWFMHCHIAWHASEGLGVIFLESKSQIKLPGAAYTNQCNTFNNWYKSSVYKKDDSGL